MNDQDGIADRNLIRELVVAMLSQTLDLPGEELSDESIDLHELGMNSIDFVELIELLEDKLGDTVEPEQLAGVRTIGDVVDLVHDLASGNATAPETAP